MRSAPLFVSSFLLGLIIAGVYLLAQTSVSNDFSPLIIPKNTATASMQEVQLIRFNTNGEKEALISMAAWFYYPDSGTTVIEHPEIMLYAHNDAIWRVAAQQGIVYHLDPTHFSKITLQKDVHLVHLSDQNTPEWQLTTNVLDLIPTSDMKLQEITTQGDPARYTGRKLSGQAEHILYNPQQAFIVLEGKATLIRENHSLQGPIIHYDLKNKVMSSKAAPEEQTVIILQPG